MKKLVMVLALVAAVISAKAASVDWSMNNVTSNDVGTKVYLLTSIPETVESIDALAAAAVDIADIKSLGRGSYGTGKVTSANAGITKTSDFYLAVVSSDGASFNYVSAPIAGNVYDPENQESSPGIYAGTTLAQVQAGASKTFGGSSGDVPEPTSGLLLLVGGAALALRRKQK